MHVRHDRIARVQARMREHGLVAIMVMNHDDYRWLFGVDRTQPRAVIPFDGPPIIVAFAAEEPEIRSALAADRASRDADRDGTAADGADGGGREVAVFGSVGGQIHEVSGMLREIAARAGTPAGTRAKVGMQQWFETPAFLVDLFKRVNPGIDLVSSDPVMDPLRMVKDPDELALMREAQRVATIGMDRARELLRPGATAHEVATEALHAMMRAGAEGTSTPIYVNVGLDTCMLHGGRSRRPMERGDFVIVDLTPQVEGYCANLARTFVLGEPDDRRRGLLDAVAEVIPAVRAAMVPGATVAALDRVAGEVLARHGLAEHQVHGIGHGLGLRFEETPASTIIPPHKNVPLREGMTMTIGHTVLAIPGFGGARHEDVYRVTPAGGEILVPYPIDPVVRVGE